MTEEVAALIYSMIFSSCKNHFYFRIFELQWAFLCLQVFFSCIFCVFLDKGLHTAFRSRLISAGFCHLGTPLVDQVILFGCEDCSCIIHYQPNHSYWLIVFSIVNIFFT